MNRYKQYTYNIISKFRNELFGIAIIMIILFHYMEDVKKLGTDYYRPVVTASQIWMNALGSVGVEIFVFLSGMGLYYSMSGTTNVVSFYKRRLSRILFPYLIVGISFWIYKDLIVRKGSVIDFLSDYLFATFWTKGTRTFWYIGFVLVIYAVFPGIYRMIQSGNDGIYNRKVILLTGMILILTVRFGTLAPVTLKNTEVAISRLLVFNLGLLFAPAIKQNKKIKWLHVLGLVGGMSLCILLRRHGAMQENAVVLERWKNAFLAVLLILVFAYLLQYLCRSKILDRILCWFGKYTLEIYLLHVALRGVFKMNDLYTGYFRNYVIMIGIALALAPLLSLMNSKIIDKIIH